MKVIMRLYRQHDLDLIYLYAQKGFSLQQAIKGALRAYVNNKPYSINVTTSNKNNDAVLPKQAQFHIVLNDDTDADLIQWILSLSRGYRNSALKNLTRSYLEMPDMFPYYDKTSLSFKPDLTKGLKQFNNEILNHQEAKPNVNSRNIEDEVLHAPIPTGDAHPVMTESNDILSGKPEQSSEDWFSTFESIIN